MRLTGAVRCLTALLLCVFVVQMAAAGNPAQRAKARPVLVGVNYFPGWWRPLPNKWHDNRGEDWRLRFPGRVPLLGEYNDQETMNREIKGAIARPTVPLAGATTQRFTFRRTGCIVE
jgi:hypothetical protein